MSTISIDVQLTEELFNELLPYADECGMTVSEYLVLITQEFLEAQDDF